jgi:anti-anti-sigma regulatory factor
VIIDDAAGDLTGMDGTAKKAELFVRSFHHEGVLIIQAIGVVTTATLETLAAVLPPVAEEITPPVTVDLRRVDLLDADGLALLVRASKCLRSPEVPRAPRVIVMPGRQPERWLSLMGAGKIIEIVHDIGGEAI